MKTRVLAACAAMMVAGSVAVQGGAAPTAPAAPAAKAPAAPAGKATPGAAKKEEPPKIEGYTLNRPNGGFLGLQITGGNFVLTFYDKEKKKTTVDVTRATLRWPVRYQPLDERTVLNPGAPSTLSSPMLVRPPYNFRVFISLFVAGTETAVETHAVDYREPTPAAAAPAKAP